MLFRRASRAPSTSTAGLLALALALPALPALSGCGAVSYLAEQGRGQLHMLKARRRITDVMADPATPADLKTRLWWAKQARDFGVEQLGLRGGDAYTRYLDTGDDPVAWSVYAAYPDRLEPFLHRFPITGAVPYLGFFDKRSAERKRDELRARGLDTFLVPVAGYSTLGYTSDPIYSSMIDGSPARIVEVVLHEMLHGTIYRPGHSEWNEALATLVGFEGAAAFFAQGRAPGDSAASIAEVREEARERDHRETELSAFLKPLTEELEALYARNIPKHEKLQLREAIFDRAMADYHTRFPPKPDPDGKPARPRAIERQRINNAVILSLTTYHRSTPVLRAALARDGGNLPRFIARLKRHYSN